MAVQVINSSSIPVITALSPGNAVAGGQGFTLIVTGAHFTNNSTVQWGSANRSTTFVNDSILTASISASDIATPVPININVINPSSGGTSNAVNFTVASTSALRIDSLSQRAGRTSGGQQIRLTGAFANLSAVMLGGVSASWGYSNGTSEITVTTPSNNVGAITIDLTPTSGNAYFKNNAFAYLPTVFTDDSLTVGVTTMKAQHIIELRQAVDALRVVAGLAPAPWTDPVLWPQDTSIKAIHIIELRTYLENVVALLGYSASSYTDPGLSGGFVIKRIHIEELRQRIRALAG
ncbi:MAG: hypothetical protein HOP19_06300 [Acidobacteria bacterium]|nr:hypothetical protein [Acidobacteriota bacterium]